MIFAVTLSSFYPPLLPTNSLLPIQLWTFRLFIVLFASTRHDHWIYLFSFFMKYSNLLSHIAARPSHMFIIIYYSSILPFLFNEIEYFLSAFNTLSPIIILSIYRETSQLLVMKSISVITILILILLFITDFRLPTYCIMTSYILLSMHLVIWLPLRTGFSCRVQFLVCPNVLVISFSIFPLISRPSSIPRLNTLSSVVKYSVSHVLSISHVLLFQSPHHKTQINNLLRNDHLVVCKAKSACFKHSCFHSSFFHGCNVWSKNILNDVGDM